MTVEPATRAEQRENTRRQIIDAAVLAFGDGGYEGTSTRAIAARAQVTQGLVTYHFPSKDELWRTAAQQVFGLLDAALPADDSGLDTRDLLRAYVRVNAAHPEILHFLVDAGRHENERMRWLVDTHLRPRYQQVRTVTGVADDLAAASLFYAVVGAASFFFAIGPECRYLTGTDPADDEAIAHHVDTVLALFTPE